MKRFLVAILVLFMSMNIVSLPVEAGTDVNLQVAEYIMSWQLDNGGWSKDNPDMFTRYWDGTEKKAKYYQRDGVTPLGTIDNDATVTQIEYLAAVYNTTRNEKVKASILKGFDFLLKMQYPTGGFPQVYPEQQASVSLYENDATFNDDATVNVLNLYKKVLDKNSEYNNGLISTTLYNQIKNSFDRGVDFILKAQVEVNGVKTVWGGQHDPYTYKTTQGRSFEPLSLISQESAKIVEFLESLNSSDPEIKRSILSAKIWFHETVLEDVKYVRDGVNGEYFIDSPGTRTWYRFYEIGTNNGLFGDRDGSVAYSIYDISTERALGYGWAGTWGKTIYYAASADDYMRELVALSPGVEEPKEEVNDDRFFSQGEWIARGNSYIDENGFHFIESGEDTIQSPVLTSVNQGDKITIEMEITQTNRESSILVMNNEGLRSQNSEWQIGYATKTRIMNFDVNADFAESDKFVAFKIDGGVNGESIDVGHIDIYVNGEKQLFTTEEPVIEEPVIEEPVIEEPVIEEPVIEEPVIEEPVIEEPIIEEPSYPASAIVFTQGTNNTYVYDNFDAVNIGDTVIIDLDIIEANTADGKLVLNNKGLRSDKSEWVIGNGVKSRHIEFTVTKEFSSSEQFLELAFIGGQTEDTLVIDNLNVTFDRVVIEEPVIEEPVIEEPVIEEPVIEEPVIEEPVIEEPVIEEPVIEEPVIEEPVIEEPSYPSSAIVFTDGSDDTYIYDAFDTVNVGDTVIIDLDIIAADTVDGKLVLDNKGLRSDKSEWVIGNGIKSRHVEFTVTEEFNSSDQYLALIFVGGQPEDTLVIDNFEVTFDRVVIEEPVIEEPVIEEPVIEEPVIEEPEEDPGVSSFSARNIEFIQGSDETFETIDLTAAQPGDTVVVKITIGSTERELSELYLNNTGLREGTDLWKIGHGVKTKTFDFVINVDDLRDSDKFLEFIIADGQAGESIFVERIEVTIN